MQDKIHPAYYDQVPVTCACGHSFTTGSTVKKIEVEICSNCHPFYTGKQKLVDTAGRVDRFRKRLQEVKPRTKQTKHKKAQVVAQKI